jgi:hypothetical protein
MSTRIIALFNLKPGITVEAYEAWARGVDLPTVRRLPSIAGFEVFRTTGLLGSDAKPPYAYVETIDIADMARFGEDVASETMKQVASAFQRMADVVFLTTERIEPDAEAV